MNIPKVSINDLISVAHPSAQTTNQSNANPASNFINMLAGYALKAGNAAGGVLSDVGNNFAAPVRDIGAYTKIQFDPQAKKQLDTINNSNLPEDQKNAQATAFMQKYGGESPDQMASSARGADTIMGTQAAAGVPDIGAMDIPAVASQAKNAASKGAQDVAQGINDIKATAQAQPGGLQAGFVNLGDNLSKAKTIGSNKVLDTLNPTGNILSKYAANERASLPLGKNITTLAETSNKHPDELVSIYRGVSNAHNAINPGDFVTTDYNLAKDYSGNGKILSQKVRLGDILDDRTEPMGGEYIYRPQAMKEKLGLPPINESIQEAAGNAKAGYNAEEQVSANPEKPAMITKNRADPHAIAQMQLNFDVPRRIAQNQQIKPDVVMNQLIEDGITGRNLDDLQRTANSITGYDQNTGLKGAFPNINDHILRSIKDPLDYSPAVESKTKNLASVLEGEKPGFINEVTKEIDKAMGPLNYNKPGELPSDLPENHAYAPDLFQTSQNLRNIARMYQRKALTDMGELNHPEMERAANAITEIKNNIDDVIDKNVPPATYKAFKDDPYVAQQLQRVPPTIAKRWMAGAERFKDGQAIQAPYVNLSNMIEDTKDTQLSVWTKAAKAMQSQNASGGVAQAVKENTPGPKIVKNIAGKVAQTAAKPFDKSADDIFEENMKGTGNIKGTKVPGGKATKVVAGLGLLGGTAALGAGYENVNNGSNAEGEGHTENSDDSHGGTISFPPSQVNGQNIETDMTKIDPKSTPVDPRSATGSDGNSLAMSDGQYQTAKAALDTLVKTDPSYITNPIKAGQLKAANDAIDTKYGASQKLMSSYQKVATVSQKIADAQDLLTKTSPVLADKIGVLEAGHEMLDPKYQSLVNDLHFIENSDPRLKGQLSNLATKGSVQTALANAAKLLLSEHNQLLKSYGAGGEAPTTNGQPATATPSQLPAGLPAPVNGALPAMNNGSYQFTAPNPMFQ